MVILFWHKINCIFGDNRNCVPVLNNDGYEMNGFSSLKPSNFASEFFKKIGI